ncbi:peptidoglycan-binding protein LysM [Ligilactobacillus salitolerans]|uniref:Peptidoglycan-binding protein LysM n=1 Tax=Ligilactobacillus salitolerans TaxID=1808352 RepID=A0A401IW26_9LACO|nr:LysM peptidoglycan-binding domain-containing protein [Ligilactobacillus salitolerans]GBG95706.1 peptidoglycan-binding protein LysM [Ligilactobacillus salitolerans]
MNAINNVTLTNQPQQAGTANQANADQAAKFATVLSSKVQAGSKTLKVKWGDTVSELAEKYQTTTDAIVQANQLQDPNLILAGQNLTIPGQSSPTGTTTSTTATGVSSSLAGVETVDDSTTSQSVGSDSESLEPPLTGAEKTARDYIIQHESSNNYNARNGRYIGKYQLDKDYLNGDFSPANQEKVAAKYVADRYGNWVTAQKHWVSHHWY